MTPDAIYKLIKPNIRFSKYIELSVSARVFNIAADLPKIKYLV